VTLRSLQVALAAAVTLQSGFAWPQQPARVPVVGMLITHAAMNDPVFDYFRVGLREHGYEDGYNIRLEIVTAEGQLDRLPALAEQLVRDKVDVIVSPNELSARAALKATSTTPIVLAAFGSDPVALGLVDSLDRPGGNITGTYTLSTELAGKRLEILKEALPTVWRIAVLWDPAFGAQHDELQRAAQSLGLQLEFIEIRSPQDLDAAFERAKRKKTRAVMLMRSSILYVQRARVASLALDARLPTVSSLNSAVEAGALMSYGPDLSGTYRRAAYFVDRLLKGAKARDLPVEQVSDLKLAINLRTARALGITIPESILLRADEVIR